MTPPLDIGVTGQYLYGCYRSVPQGRYKVHSNLQPLTGQGSNPMKHQALRWLQVSLGLLLFAAGGGQPGGFDLMAQQVQVMGARQWLGLMAGAAIGPGSPRIARARPRHQPRELWYCDTPPMPALSPRLRSPPQAAHSGKSELKRLPATKWPNTAPRKTRVPMRTSFIVAARSDRARSDAQPRSTCYRKRDGAIFDLRRRE